MIRRKHYEAIAEILNREGGRPWERLSRQEAISDAAKSLADYFESDNPHFDRAKFLKAAGIDM